MTIFGQVPTQTVTVYHPSTSMSITLTGPPNEIAQATALMQVLAAGARDRSNNGVEGNKLIARAAAMLPATGSLRSKLEPIVNEVTQSALAFSTEHPTKTFLQHLFTVQGATSPGGMAIFGGFGGLGLLIILLLLRR